jgi:SseB protein N-terminal domain
VSGHLKPGGQQFRDDNGAADPRVAAALAGYQTGQGSEQAALTELATARLLVPVIAVLAGGSAADGAADGAAGGSAVDGAADRDKNSEMVLPTLIGRDGRPAVLAFTSLDALARWRPDARPVPAEAGRVWRAAVADGCAVVIDVAGPVPFAVEGARLGALAAGQPVPPAHEDPDLRAEIDAAVAGEPVILGFTLASSDQADVAIRLCLSGPSLAADGWQPVANRVANNIAARLAGRLRRGVEFTVTCDPIGS